MQLREQQPSLSNLPFDVHLPYLSSTDQHKNKINTSATLLLNETQMQA